MSHILVLTSAKYNYGEFWPVLRVFKKRGHTFDVVSNKKIIRPEQEETYNSVHKVLDDIKSVDGYDAIVVVSGDPTDTEFYWHDPHTQKLIQEATDKELVLAAICAAVPTIRIGLKGKKASSFPLVKIEELLLAAEVIRRNASMTTDGRTVTAENEAMASMWAINICDVLEGKDPSYVFNDVDFKVITKKRHPPKVIRTILEQKRGKQ